MYYKKMILSILFGCCLLFGMTQIIDDSTETMSAKITNASILDTTTDSAAFFKNGHLAIVPWDTLLKYVKPGSVDTANVFKWLKSSRNNFTFIKNTDSTLDTTSVVFDPGTKYTTFSSHVLFDTSNGAIVIAIDQDSAYAKRELTISPGWPPSTHIGGHIILYPHKHAYGDDVRVWAGDTGTIDLFSARAVYVRHCGHADSLSLQITPNATPRGHAIHPVNDNTSALELGSGHTWPLIRMRNDTVFILGVLAGTGAASFKHGVTPNYCAVAETDSTFRDGLIYDDGDSIIHTEDAYFDSSLYLESTTTSKLGVIYKNGSRFLLDFHHPTGGGAVPIGLNLFIGRGAGNFTMGATATTGAHGSYNLGIGTQTLYKVTTGFYNVALGTYALHNLTEGSYCWAAGVGALYSNTTGTNNFGAGYNALYANTTGLYNYALGRETLSALDGGHHNFGGGNMALQFILNSSYNIGISSKAGSYLVGGGTNTTGSKSIFIGYDTRPAADGETNEIVMGHLAEGIGSNTTTIGNTNTVTTKLFGDILMEDDYVCLIMGAGQDAKIYYDGSDLIVDCRVIGSGDIKINGNIYPNTDDTYYIGKNDDDSPLAYKGIILKDQTDGKYYRMELNNSSLDIVDLTD